MGIRSYKRWSVSALTVAALLTTGTACASGEEEPPQPLADVLPLGLPGEYREPFWSWVPRGSLTDDAELLAEVSTIAKNWRTPDGFGIKESFSAIAWLGEVDETVLAVVDFRPIDRAANSWILEISGVRNELTVTQARAIPPMFSSFTHELLPIRSPGLGPRYLVSENVESVQVGSVEPGIDDGLTEVLQLPSCEMTEVTVIRRQDRSDREQSDARFLDLGMSIPAPQYPLIQEWNERDEGRHPLTDIDTCQATRTDGWYSSLLEALHDEMPATAEIIRTFTVDTGPVQGLFTEIEFWGSVEVSAHRVYIAHVIVWRPDGGRGVASAAVPEYPLPQVFTVAAEPGPMCFITYPDPTDLAPRNQISDVGVPSSNATTLVDEPGLLVLLLPDNEDVEITYKRSGEPEHLTITGDLEIQP